MKGELFLGICFVIFTILGCYCLMVVVSTFNLINEKEKERSARGAVPGDAGGALSAQGFYNSIEIRGVNSFLKVGGQVVMRRAAAAWRPSILPKYGGAIATPAPPLLTPLEISVITPSAPVTNPRMQYLRSPSLPAYENVVSEQRTKNIETPPPNYYDETVNKFDYF